MNLLFRSRWSYFDIIAATLIALLGGGWWWLLAIPAFAFSVWVEMAFNLTAQPPPDSSTMPDHCK